MKRRLFYSCAIVSAALFVASVVLWFASAGSNSSGILLSTDRANGEFRTYDISTIDRRIFFATTVNRPSGSRAQPRQEFYWQDYSWSRGLFCLVMMDDYGVSRGGFGMAHFKSPQADNLFPSGTILSCPLWFVILIAMVLPGFWVRLFIRVRTRKRLGLCSRCGYDLRASTGRCPECGMRVD